jgi:hypothetical protein
MKTPGADSGSIALFWPARSISPSRRGVEKKM